MCPPGSGPRVLPCRSAGELTPVFNLGDRAVLRCGGFFRPLAGPSLVLVRAPARDEVIVLWIRVSDVRGFLEMDCDVIADPGGDLGARKGGEDAEGRKGSCLLSTPGIAADLNRKLFDISVLQFECNSCQVNFISNKHC